MLTVHDMREQQVASLTSTTKFSPLANKAIAKDKHTLILSGYGVSLRVKHNALVIYPGKVSAGEPEYITLYAGTHQSQQITNIIITGRKGQLSLDAITFCQQQNITLTLIDALSGDLISTITSEPEANITTRRKQYAATPGKVASALIHQKINKQLSTLQQHQELPQAERAIEIITDALSWFNMKSLPARFYDVSWLMTYEARCASVYFEAMYGQAIKWDKKSSHRIPPHWKVITERTSPLSKNHGGRHAINPFHACLNYLYAVLESQCRLALITSGLDIACGFLHADSNRRDSLVYDLMELYRSEVDGLLLDFFAKVTFSYGDFLPNSDGSIKINPELLKLLIATCRVDQADIYNGCSWLIEQLV